MVKYGLLYKYVVKFDLEEKHAYKYEGNEKWLLIPDDYYHQFIDRLEFYAISPIKEEDAKRIMHIQDTNPNY